MGLIDHAKKELELAGLLDGGSDYESMLGKVVLELVEALDRHQNIGISNQDVGAVCCKLFVAEPLTPLTGEDDEWQTLFDGIEQNKRDRRVFRENKTDAYQMDYYIFDACGSWYTSSNSTIRNITFPYTPNQVAIQVCAGATPEQELEAIKRHCGHG